MNIPAGYHVITPYFTVPDADRLIEFLNHAFGGTLLVVNRRDDGRIGHARVRIGDSVVMLNDSSGQYSANVSQMHLYVRDLEVTYAAALAAGAVSIMTPNRRPHGDRMAGVRDPCDNIWWLAQPGED